MREEEEGQRGRGRAEGGMLEVTANKCPLLEHLDLSYSLNPFLLSLPLHNLPSPPALPRPSLATLDAPPTQYTLPRTTRARPPRSARLTLARRLGEVECVLPLLLLQESHIAVHSVVDVHFGSHTW
ncbi:hypothetical protein E2C01_091791 [Portunus trituberculatus]|uniref:Uncharacterized protein n=1 Tax=Portunus trituberculatus TaxID=210409 RepID=A0A5B7JTW7_PORTR|nr:hypothetical protein [Portunus trituberculatus]